MALAGLHDPSSRKPVPMRQGQPGVALMVVAARRLCAQLGCPTLVSKGRCPAHDKTREQRRRYYRNDPRGSSTRQGYGSAWRRLRVSVLAATPYCPCGAGATEVDHIKPRSQGGADDPSNLQALCKPCHSRKTARQRRSGG